MIFGVDFFSAGIILLGLSIFVFYAKKIVANEFLAWNFFMLAYSLFGIVDIAKYRLLDRHLRGEFGADVELKAIILTLSIPFLVWFFKCLAIFKREHVTRSVLVRSSRQRVLLVLLGCASCYGILLLGILPRAFEVMCFFVLVGIVIQCAFEAQNLRSKWVFFLSLIILMAWLLSADFASRRAYIAVFIPILFLVLRSSKTMNLRRKVFVFFAGISFFIYLNYMRSEHVFGAGYIEGDVVSNTLSYITTLRSIDIFWNTAFIIDFFENQGGDLYFGSTFFSVFVGLIPRAIWEDKPVGFAALLGMIQFYGYQVKFTLDAWEESNFYSLSPGIIGEGYANLHVFGVLLYCFMIGRLVRLIDSRIKAVSMAHYSALVGVVFLSLRGDFYSAFLFPFYIFFGGVVAQSLYSRQV